jgi:hypothetical protein
MQVWNFADFAAVQSIMRVGGLNMKGIFTRSRTPKMAAHVLREFWVEPANQSQPDENNSLQSSRNGRDLLAGSGSTH